MRLVRVAAAALLLTAALAGPVLAGEVTDVSVTKTDSPDPVAAGSNITYTITVQNAGPQAATNVSASDVIPTGTTFVSIAGAAGWTMTTPPAGGTGTVTMTNPSLTSAAGAQVFTLVVQVAPATPVSTVITNTATVSSATFDPNQANNSATTTTTVASAAPTPTPAASLVNAAMPTPGSGNPLAILGFAVLLVSALSASAVLAVRRVRT